MDDLNVTVSAAPNRSGLKMTICIYSRDRVEGESENEEREPGGPRRGLGHNTARRAGKRAWEIGEGVVAYVGLGRRAPRRARGGRNEREGGRAVRSATAESSRPFFRL